MSPPTREQEATHTERRDAILDAARARFAALGFQRTTIRGVAADVQVDPALVMHYFGNKRRLFAEAMELPFDPTLVIPELLGDLDEGAGERVVRFFLELIDDPGASPPLVGIVRAGLSSEEGLPMLRELVESVLLATAASHLDSEGRLRANLVGSQLLGIFLTRRVVIVEPIASTETDTLVAAYAPTIQRYLTGPIG